MRAQLVLPAPVGAAINVFSPDKKHAPNASVCRAFRWVMVPKAGTRYAGKLPAMGSNDRSEIALAALVGAGMRTSSHPSSLCHSASGGNEMLPNRGPSRCAVVFGKDAKKSGADEPLLASCCSRALALRSVARSTSRSRSRAARSRFASATLRPSSAASRTRSFSFSLARWRSRRRSLAKVTAASGEKPAASFADSMGAASGAAARRRAARFVFSRSASRAASAWMATRSLTRAHTTSTSSKPSSSISEVATSSSDGVLPVDALAEVSVATIASATAPSKRRRMAERDQVEGAEASSWPGVEEGTGALVVVVVVVVVGVAGALAIRRSSRTH
mmetsp:Transcript_6973/g.22378  ORF Transcript_6973/g.22378 Transcript_6973/m.22378 type:complete len:332 (+) Transcript_6973:836-1831(+)